MDTDQARAILEEAIREDAWDSGMPEDAEVIEVAEYLLREAHKAHDVGMKHPSIEPIMRLGGWEPEVSSSVDGEPSVDRGVDDSSSAQVDGEDEGSRPVESSSEQKSTERDIESEGSGSETESPGS